MTTMILPRSAERTAPAATPLLTRFVEGYKALRDGLQAYRRYELLRARGFSHEEAARRSFDLDFKV